MKTTKSSSVREQEMSVRIGVRPDRAASLGWWWRIKLLTATLDIMMT